MAEREVTVYDGGKVQKRIPPEVLQFVLLDDIAVSLREVEGSLKREEFEGRLDERPLLPNDQIQLLDLINEFPHTPWATCYLYNSGLKTAYVSINKATDWQVLVSGGDLTIDFLKADKRISFIYYKCGTGETTSLTATGKY